MNSISYLVERDAADPGQRVAQRDARVGERARVDDDEPVPVLVILVVAVVAAPRAESVHPVKDRALVVRLEALHVAAQLGPERPRARFDSRERVRPVRLRLARAEQVEVRSIEQQDARAARGGGGGGGGGRARAYGGRAHGGGGGGGGGGGCSERGPCLLDVLPEAGVRLRRAVR